MGKSYVVEHEGAYRVAGTRVCGESPNLGCTKL